MTFRSLATLLGGVPADVADTPGEPAGTRFVGFGEALTSAIANRPHYALAENTDDLNTRIAIWETSGLDASYDLGTAAVPGGGRIITKDAGAVETASTLTTLYEDDPLNAHYRADMTGDTKDGGAGYDAVSVNARRCVGFIDRRAVGITDDTIIAAGGQACTLASGGGDRVRLDSGGRWKLSAATNLGLSFEVIEITGAPASENGLYLLSTFISDDTATLVNLDGTVAVFSAGTATATLYRRKFASAQYGLDEGALFHGLPTRSAAVTALSGRANSGDTLSGSVNAFITPYRDGGGIVNPALAIDLYGRLNYTLDSSLMDAEADDNWGGYGYWVNKVGTSALYEAGYLFQTQDLGQVYALQSMMAINTGAAPDTCAFSFTTPADDVDFTGSSGGIAFQQQIPLGTFVQIITPTAQAGYYYITDKVASDTKVATLSKLDGTAPGLPTAGAGTARFFTGTSIGRRNLAGFVAPTTTGGGFAAQVDMKPELYTSGPMLIAMPDDAQEGFRIHRAGGGVGGNDDDQVIMVVDKLGNVYSGNDHFIEGDYLFQNGKSRQTTIPMTLGTPNHSAGGNPDWELNNFFGDNAFLSVLSNGGLSFPIQLPHGATLTNVIAVFKHNTSPTASDENQMRVYKRTSLDFGVTPASGSSVQIGGTLTGATGTAVQRHALGGLSELIDNITSTYIISFTASDSVSGDDLYGIQLTWTDPGPRNH